MNLILESKRDERTLIWLVQQVGEAKVASACQLLAGNRRAYPSNVAKALGLKPPKNLSVAADEDARKHIAAIAQLLGVTPCI